MVRTEISNRVTITISRITTVAEDKNPPLVPFRDSLLTNIVAFVNSQPRDEAGYPVTLLVNGATISGHIIPAANYCEEFGSKTGLGSFIAPLTEDMVGCRGEDLSDEISREATVFSNSGTMNLGLWRGSLAEVAGFSVGILGPGTTDVDQ